MKRLYDASETATHTFVARQLRALSDDIAAGAVRLSYDDLHEPTPILDPIDVVIDMRRSRRHTELVVRLRWGTEPAETEEPAT